MRFIFKNSNRPAPIPYIDLSACRDQKVGFIFKNLLPAPSCPYTDLCDRGEGNSGFPI